MQIEELKKMVSKNKKIIGKMKLALGTAQFGIPYGISNRNGIVQSEMKVKKIIYNSYRVGIDTIDTAKNYGNCEGWQRNWSKKI